MQKNYLESLKSVSKKFTKREKIFDIVLYGSTTKGKDEGRDIDILIIFENLKLKKRTEISQDYKKNVKELVKNIDVKTINLKEFFDKEFLARTGVFVEGISLVYKTPFSERLGFEGYILFTYDLKNLSHNKKTKFIYALIGRKKEGMLKKLEAKHLGRGAIIVPIKNGLIFEEFLERWKINYKLKRILVSIL